MWRRDGRLEVREHSALVSPVSTHRHHAPWQNRLYRLYNWSLWTFVLVLQLSQTLAVFSASHKTENCGSYGRSPLDGIGSFPGSNDDPFTDRALVCSLRGRLYRAKQLSAALSAAPTQSREDGRASINGYRVIDREGFALSPEVLRQYDFACGQIAVTLDGLMDACFKLGYNVSGVQHLRVVTDNDALINLETALPVLVLPYWDNAISYRTVIPTQDGRGCMFRVSGKYNDPSAQGSYLRAVNRTVREKKTTEWLRLDGGMWRHGWYEHAASQSRWYSDVISNNRQSELALRQFDVVARAESDCDRTTVCEEVDVKQWWGRDLYVVSRTLSFESVTIMNGKRRGLFLYNFTYVIHPGTIYRLETLISNLSLAVVLARWLIALAATHSVGETIGIGALACSRSFQALPILLLPRLRTIFVAFLSAGCFFEGEQGCLSEAYFVMYPAISEFVMFYYSGINFVAKALHRRVSDAFFGPTLVTLCALHFLRFDIAQSAWFGIYGRVTSAVSSTEFENTRLVQFFSPSFSFRLAGRVTSLYTIKMSLTIVQMLIMLIFSDSTRRRSHSSVGAAEKALAIRVAWNGGLGWSPMHTIHNNSPKPVALASHDAVAVVPLDSSARRKSSRRRSTQQEGPRLVVLPYEVIRAGFLILGHDALVTSRDWALFLIARVLRKFHVPMDHVRISVFALDDESSSAQVATVRDHPRIIRVTDAQLDDIRATDISLRPLG